MRFLADFCVLESERTVQKSRRNDKTTNVGVACVPNELSFRDWNEIISKLEHKTICSCYCVTNSKCCYNISHYFAIQIVVWYENEWKIKPCGTTRK